MIDIFRKGNASVLSAGAAECDDKRGLSLVAVQGEKEVDKVFELFVKLLGAVKRSFIPGWNIGEGEDNG